MSSLPRPSPRQRQQHRRRHQRPQRRIGLAAVLALVAVLLLTPPAVGGPAPVTASGVWPLVPAPLVAHGFEPPPLPWLPGHRGVDLLGTPGQPVRAALGGTVTFAGSVAGRGVVVVDHGPHRTTYQPVAAEVRRGHRVTAGAILGTLSLAGSHCAPRACLHWGLVAGRTYLDPLTLVGLGPVRLLPLLERPPGGPVSDLWPGGWSPVPVAGWPG